MKYLMMAYTNLAAWDEMDPASPEFIAACEFYERLGAELTASGEFVSTEGLAHPALTRVVRKGADGAVAIDGPFAETKEVAASFAIIDVASHDRALEIAARIVEALGEPIEVRPIGSGPEDSMPPVP
ncbi:YciI family protein [Phytomonospora endophytica]|uniref:YCII-related domain-containing protein n=1 Tax=Phytomonospora endophytica TaxID=714109 RepID=A0A841FVJ5_9ACTN|nr:YciI family protein [Phytomonospora endophytica]MBB6037552.1 hypothetical protein [Phytomonospora endophytica]GIG70253.1 hypothetical protein Pen01_65480 [Phytomonospora endophytica]